MAVVEAKTLEPEGAALVQTAQALVITDEASFQRAADGLRLVKAFLGRIDEAFGPIDRAQIEARRVTIEQRKGLERYPKEAEAVYKGGMAAYTREQELIRRAQEESARRERERLEREEAARVQAENERLRKDAEDRRIAAAVEIAEAGDTVGAAKLLDAPIEAPVVQARPVFVPPVPVAAPPKAAGVSMRKAFTFRVTNPDLIPRQYLIPDEKAIGATVRALGMRAQVTIPGIEVVEETVVAARARS